MAKSKTPSQQGQGAKKANQLNRELDRLIAQFGPAYPGLASVLNGARKLLHTPAPKVGGGSRLIGSKRTVIF